MKITIEKVDNGFLVEHEVFHYEPSRTHAYAYEVTSSYVKRHVVLTLEGAFTYATEVLK